MPEPLPVEDYDTKNSENRDVPNIRPLAFLWQSFRALLPAFAVDIGGTMIVYYVLASRFPSTSIWPILGASLVPVASNVINLIRRRTVDIIGLIILLGMIASIIPTAFGGSQRLLLVREAFFTGFIGLVLLISPFVMKKPILYYVLREFLTANDTLPESHFDILWRTWYFRNGTRIATLVWGAVLLGDFVMRGFIALNMNVAFALGVAPILSTILLLLTGAATGVWLSNAISGALASRQS